MKIKWRKDVYISIPTEWSTCTGCAFISDNGVICKAPDSIYTSCLKCNRLFHRSQNFFKIFDL